MAEIFFFFSFPHSLIMGEAPRNAGSPSRESEAHFALRQGLNLRFSDFGQRADRRFSFSRLLYAPSVLENLELSAFLQLDDTPQPIT